MLACLMGKMQVSSEKGSLLVTDFEENVLQRCEENLKLSRSMSASATSRLMAYGIVDQFNKVRISRLDWSAEEDIDALPDFNLVIGADLVTTPICLDAATAQSGLQVYDPDLVPMLVGCLTRLLKRPAKTVPSILLSITVRIVSTLQLFLETCGERSQYLQKMSG